MSHCPVDGSACPDDLCHGAGCVRANGEPMLERCAECGATVPEDELGGGCMDLCEKCELKWEHGFDELHEDPDPYLDDDMPPPAWEESEASDG